MYERALRGYERLLGPDHASTLSTVGNLADLLADLNLWVEAKSMYQRCVDGYEKALGREHPRTLRHVNNFAIDLKSRGETAEREALLARFPKAKR